MRRLADEALQEGGGAIGARDRPDSPRATLVRARDVDVDALQAVTALPKQLRSGDQRTSARDRLRHLLGGGAAKVPDHPVADAQDRAALLHCVRLEGQVAFSVSRPNERLFRLADPTRNRTSSMTITLEWTMTSTA